MRRFYCKFLANTIRLKGSGCTLKWIVIFSGILFILLVMILFSSVNIIIDYNHKQGKDNLHVIIKGLFGLFRYKLSVPMIKVSRETPGIKVKKKAEKGPAETDASGGKDIVTPEDMLKSIKDFKTLVEHISGFYKVVRSFLRKVFVEYLEWHSKIGTGDAAITGMAAGALWAAKGNVLGLVARLMKLKKLPKITITPYFQSTIAETSIKCMFRFRLGNAIFAGLKLVKLWKGDEARFRTRPLSVLSKGKTKSV